MAVSSSYFDDDDDDDDDDRNHVIMMTIAGQVHEKEHGGCLPPTQLPPRPGLTLRLSQQQAIWLSLKCVHNVHAQNVLVAHRCECKCPQKFF